MEIRHQFEIGAPAERVWDALGERFMQVGQWAAPITSSCPVGRGEPGPGATRCCSHGAVGPIQAGIVKERLSTFDRAGMALEYEAIEGMPSFVTRATNRFSVARLDDSRSVVHAHATLALRGPARFFSCLVKWQLRAAGKRFGEELAYFVEHGHPHPRKQASLRKAP